jgi:hypothetical protein
MPLGQTAHLGCLAAAAGVKDRHGRCRAAELLIERVR